MEHWAGSRAESDSSPDTARWVRLNVGGKNFHTTTATLLSQPSRIAEWCRSKFRDVQRDAEGIPFIDRDPDNFQVVLNFLRGYELDLTPEEVFSVLEDATYYELPQLISHLGGDSRSATTFLPGPGVSADGSTFSASTMVGHCGGFVSSGLHSVMFHAEKVFESICVGVVNATGDTCSGELLGRRGTICYMYSGELTMNMEGTVAVTPGVKMKDGDYIKVCIKFHEDQGTATVSFSKGPDAVVHTVDVALQPLRIVVWVHGGFTGCMSIVETTSFPNAPRIGAELAAPPPLQVRNQPPSPVLN